MYKKVLCSLAVLMTFCILGITKASASSNFPSVVLSYRHIVGTGYVATASCVNDEETEGLVTKSNNGEFTFLWGIKVDEDDIEWNISSNLSYNVGLTEEDKTVTVYFKISDSAGNESIPIFKNIVFREMFQTNYKYVVVNSANYVFYATADDYEINTPSEPFKIAYMYNAFDPTDNVLSPAMVDKYIKGKVCYLKFPSGTRMTGQKDILYHKWSFSLFNSSYFNRKLSQVINKKPADGTVIDAGFIICNAVYEELQAVPFSIIYISNFLGDDINTKG